MSLSAKKNLYFLKIGLLLCATQVFPLSLPKLPERETLSEQNMVADMLELARAGDIRAACPRSDTFCLPRVKCPVKSVIYDREGLRFILGPDQVILNPFIHHLSIFMYNCT